MTSGRLSVVAAEGQAIIGEVRSGLTKLETGLLYSLRGGAGVLGARLTSPKASCSIPDGRSLTVSGTVEGSELKSWTLEAAPGHRADSGFQTIAEGSSAISAGNLGVWNTAGLSGWQTLRLTAVDQSASTAVSRAEVFIGDPRNAFPANGSKLAWPDAAKTLVRPCIQ